MASRRKSLLSDRETVAGLVTVLTPIARRLATDKELRDQLRDAAESLTAAYRKTRVAHEGRRAADSRIYAYEEAPHAAAHDRVDAEIVDEPGRSPRRRPHGAALKLGLVAATAAGAAGALLASRRTGPWARRTAGRALHRSRSGSGPGY